MLTKDIYDALPANLSRQIKQKQVVLDGTVKTAGRFMNHRAILMGQLHNRVSEKQTLYCYVFLLLLFHTPFIVTVQEFEKE